MLLKLVPNKLKVWLVKQLYKDLASKGRMGDTRLAHINDYEANLLKAVGGSGTINPTTGLTEYKGGGGGTTQTTATTSTLPEYAQPFYEELMKQTAQQTYTTDPSGNVTGVKEFTPYTGDRLVGFTPEQQAVQQGVMGLQTPGQFGSAAQTLGNVNTMGTAAAAQGITGALGYNPGTTESLAMTTPTNVPSFQYAGNAANPYTSAVTDQAIAEARRQGDVQANKFAMGSIGRGTFGGGREALMSGENNAGTNRLIADLRAKGNQSAFENAQQQFERDRAANINVGGQNLQAEQQRRQMEQQGGQFTAGLQKDLGLTGLGTTLQSAQATGALGGQEQAANLERLKAQSASANEQQAQAQELANIEYQKYREAEDYERKLLEYQSNILRGNAGALGTTEVQYAPAPSLASQLTGTGVAGLGLYKAMSGG
jgi:hypothetical protein